MRNIGSKDEITEIIRADSFMMEVLKAAELLNLPDWWIGAGFLRNKIWDYIEGNESILPKDVDLVYFDAQNNSKESDWAFSDDMNAKYSFAEWEIRNQARMHYINGFNPFISTEDGISHWVETATCVAVKIDDDRLNYLFCYGTDDLFNLIARPTPYFRKKPLLQEFTNRVEQKKWQQRWPSLKVRPS